MTSLCVVLVHSCCQWCKFHVLASLLSVLKLSRSMDLRNLLGEVCTCSDKVSWVLLVNDSLCRRQLILLASDNLEELLNLLPVRVALINIFVKCVETLGHDLSAFFKAHASLILVMQLIESRFGDSCPHAQFAFAVVVCHPGQIRCPSIFSGVVRFNPCPSRRINQECFQLSINRTIVQRE